MYRSLTYCAVAIVLTFQQGALAAEGVLSVTHTETLSQELAQTQGLVATPWHAGPAEDLNRRGKSISSYPLAWGVYQTVQHRHVGFAWNSGDQKTAQWRPQGLSGLAHAERKFLLISWYHRSEDISTNKGVRLSLVDVTKMDDVRYRHLLLVEPTADAEKYPVFQPVHIHAGGLAVVGNLLFVADTEHGLRVFDLNQVFPAEAEPTKSKCGIHAGTCYAFDYAYILPQKLKYTLAAPPFSFVSYDAAGQRLITGSFVKSEEVSTPPQLSLWTLNTEQQITGGERKIEGGLPHFAQGAVRVVKPDVAYWAISTSYKRGHHQLFIQADSPEAEAHTWKQSAWPIGAEDLHYASRSDNLWCLTEFRRLRIVFAVKGADYLPP